VLSDVQTSRISARVPFLELEAVSKSLYSGP